MKSLMLLLFIMLMQNVNAVTGIFVSDGSRLVFYNLENNTRKDIITINNLNLWEFGDCHFENGKCILTLYKSSDYHYFNRIGYVSGIIVTIDKNEVALKNDTIFIKDDVFYRHSDSRIEKLSITNIKDVYYYKSRLSDDAGAIYISDSTKNVIPILKPKQLSNGYEIGFFNPSLSPNGEKIVCEKIIGKHDWKKRQRKAVIVEYDIKNKRLYDWNLKGKFPSYSKDGSYILYQSEGNCCIYDIKNQKELFCHSGQQAIWVEF